MEVKSSGVKLAAILVFLWMLIFSLVMYLYDRGLWGSIAICSATSLVLFRHYIAFGKTIYINETGCTVKLWFYKKTYSWSELKTKRIENFDQRLCGRGDPYVRGVVFSTKSNFKTPELIAIETYLMCCLNPFAFFVVLFQPHDSHTRMVHTYEVDEETFMEKMESFGITIEKR